MNEFTNEQNYGNVVHVVMHDAKFAYVEDYYQFLDTLKELRDEGHWDIFAYCLMPGCAQILIRERDWDIVICMKPFESCTYDGNLDYEYEICKDIDRFLTLFRFVHQSPVRIGLSDSPGDYIYSSWTSEYSQSNPHGICNTSVVLKRLPIDKLSKAVDEPLGKVETCLDYAPFE